MDQSQWHAGKGAPNGYRYWVAVPSTYDVVEFCTGRMLQRLGIH